MGRRGALRRMSGFLEEHLESELYENVAGGVTKGKLLPTKDIILVIG